MVVRDFDLVGIATLPTETDAVLIINANAVLSTPTATQAFKAIPGRNCQLANMTHTVELVELAAGNAPQIPRAGSASPQI